MKCEHVKSEVFCEIKGLRSKVKGLHVKLEVGGLR
jgi:hypothetical protein